MEGEELYKSEEVSGEIEESNSRHSVGWRVFRIRQGYYSLNDIVK